MSGSSAGTAAGHEARQPRLFLVRHGQTDWSASGQHTGWTDVPLNDTGRRQAALLAARLAPMRFAAVFTSPLVRALDTCRAAGLAEEATVDPDLREWDYGEYEGRTTDEIRETQPGWSIWADAVPGGETIDDVAARVDRVIERTLRVEGDVAIFGHGHCLRILAARWLRLEPEIGGLLELSTATISRLGWERERRVLELWNDAAHLDAV
jgi:broad specificity phosphatase PhoE